MARQEASRVNGAKSKGPVTAEGKKRSSRNGFKHGLSAGSFILLPQESTERFTELAETYGRVLDPQDEAQRDLAFEAAACMWRMLRIMGAESSLIEAEIARQREFVNQQFDNPTDHLRIALALEGLANNGKALALLHRYETRLSRTKMRCLEHIRNLKAEVQLDDPPKNTPPSEALPKEPEVSPEAPARDASPVLLPPALGSSISPSEPEAAREPALYTAPNETFMAAKLAAPKNENVKRADMICCRRHDAQMRPAPQKQGCILKTSKAIFGRTRGRCGISGLHRFAKRNHARP